jgi:acyl dehydratase
MLPDFRYDPKNARNGPAGRAMREPKLFWEDFPPGYALERQGEPITKAEIIEFAAEFDPQPFHLDEAAAASSMLGGLCASGWHTCAMIMRIMCDACILDSASLGAPGVEEGRWTKPVFVGDTLTVRLSCLERRPSKSRPEMGLTRFQWDAFNQNNVLVASLRSWGMFARRHPGEAA